MLANVNSVDLPNRKCNVTTVSGNSTLEYEVSLQAVISDGLLIEPSIDSTVFVLFSKYTLPFIVQFGDISSYSFNGVEFGGLVKVKELTKKLNSLEEKVNTILTWALSVSPPLTSTQILPTMQIEIENKTIQHGS